MKIGDYIAVDMGREPYGYDIITPFHRIWKVVDIAGEGIKCIAVFPNNDIETRWYHDFGGKRILGWWFTHCEPAIDFLRRLAETP